jgi:hypothetical protein
LGSRNLKDRQMLRPSISSINLQRERYPPHQIGTGLGGLRGSPERELDPEHWQDSTATQKRLSAKWRRLGPDHSLRDNSSAAAATVIWPAWYIRPPVDGEWAPLRAA